MTIHDMPIFSSAEIKSAFNTLINNTPELIGVPTQLREIWANNLVTIAIQEKGNTHDEQQA